MAYDGNQPHAQRGEAARAACRVLRARFYTAIEAFRADRTDATMEAARIALRNYSAALLSDDGLRYVLDFDVASLCTLPELIAANDFDHDTLCGLRALRAGESVIGGGGAAAVFVVTAHIADIGPRCDSCGEFAIETTRGFEHGCPTTMVQA